MRARAAWAALSLASFVASGRIIDGATRESFLAAEFETESRPSGFPECVFKFYAAPKIPAEIWASYPFLTLLCQGFMPDNENGQIGIWIDDLARHAFYWDCSVERPPQGVFEQAGITPCRGSISWRLANIGYHDLQLRLVTDYGENAIRWLHLDIGPQFAFCRIAQMGQLSFTRLPKPTGGDPQAYGRDSKNNSENGRDGPVMVVKDFSNLDDKEWKHAVSGAIFLFGLFGYLAYLIVRRD